MFINLKLLLVLLLIILLGVWIDCARGNAAENKKIEPPVAQIVPHQYKILGDTIIDNYFWLRNKSDPHVMKYLEAESAYTEKMMKHTEKLQEKLYREMLARIKQTDLNVPEKIDDYYYYSRTEEGKQYSIYCRKKGTLEAEEEVILDQNEIAKGQPFCEIGVFRVSPDHRLLMYSVDTSGAEQYDLRIKDLVTGALFPEVITNTDITAEWANDNKTIFYVTVDETRRPYRLYRHVLGTSVQDDKLIYEEKDKAFSLSIDRTKDRAFLLMCLESNTTSEIRYLDANDPEGEFKIIHPRESGMEYSVAHHGNKFYILSNDKAKNFHLLEVEDNNPAKSNWKEIIPHNEKVMLEGFETFRDHLVVYERENGLKKIRIRNLNNNRDHYVEFPEPVYTYWTAANSDFNTNLLRFSYTSLITPETVYDYNMDTCEQELKKQYEVLGGYDPSLYQSERIFARSHDGTMVPISLVYKKKEMARNGKNPLLLESYGAYGDSSEPYFFSPQLTLLDRGIIYALAHVRGGGEMGRSWYEQGKLLHKKNTFLDFIACAEHLIKEKYTSPDRLIIRGESAGGLLIGAVTNMRPDLFKAVIAKVPFVDVLNTMLDPSLPLTVSEYEEWGNPRVKKYYEYIKSYSPYDNVTAQDYPHILAITSINDTRVMYWEPAKWVAKLRALKTDSNLLLFKINLVTGGHSGPSGRYDYFRELAFEYAFVFEVLKIGE